MSQSIRLMDVGETTPLEDVFDLDKLAVQKWVLVEAERIRDILKVTEGLRATPSMYEIGHHIALGIAALIRHQDDTQVTFSGPLAVTWGPGRSGFEVWVRGGAVNWAHIDKKAPGWIGDPDG